MSVLEVRRLGRTRYEEGHALQKELVEQRADDALGDLLLLTEHEPVVTVGRGTPRAELDALERSGLPVVEVERGGEATYHGPGQLVAYPIVHLTEARRDLHRFQRDLEELGIRVCAEFGVEAKRVTGLTGVWVGARKVMSLGIAVRRWVSWHGIALNVSTDLEPFRRFHPCGLDGDVMTSLAECAGADPGFGRVRESLVRLAGEILPGGPFAPWSFDELLAAGGAPAEGPRR